MTKQQKAFLSGIKQLDDIQLGCLAVGDHMSAKEQKLKRQCADRGWIRLAEFADPWGDVMHLSTKGLRALQRACREYTNRE